MYDNDTIAAISTPYGTGGIGIIRISGENAFEIVKKIFSGKTPFEKIRSHSIRYGKIIEPESGETIDEVLISKMQKPNTFTREDVVEINCHGGTLVLKRILELVVKQGARLAEPGEFTKRAFLNGRIDLSQAEAVIDLINSKTGESSRAAVDQLEGKLSKRIKEARQKLIELIAHIEVTVDYPEHDIEEITGENVYKELVGIKRMLGRIVEGFDKGRIIREGINAVIIGRPNVGKSSLLNELSGKTRAIVTDIPGTTRDIIEEYININGIPVRITDTAGIRETEDIVEKIGVESARKAIEKADLIIMMMDAKDGIRNEDISLLNMIKHKKHIIVFNKMDLIDDGAGADPIEGLPDEEKENVVKTSLKEDFGIDHLQEEITRLFMKGGINPNSEYLVTNIRHKDAIDKALDSINEALKAFESKMPLDLVTIDIKNAAEFLGQITGESVSEDVMHEIFSRFCLGK
ncbi:MAG: tRNA uridine-5-carboxymethylaminomethyl(34) synthesis GTPase MnmE [Acetivibrionales bacterium]|jgi:tRNA modification GTPase